VEWCPARMREYKIVPPSFVRAGGPANLKVKLIR